MLAATSWCHEIGYLLAQTRFQYVPEQRRYLLFFPRPPYFHLLFVVDALLVLVIYVYITSAVWPKLSKKALKLSCFERCNGNQGLQRSVNSVLQTQITIHFVIIRHEENSADLPGLFSRFFWNFLILSLMLQIFLTIFVEIMIVMTNLELAYKHQRKRV